MKTQPGILSRYRALIYALGVIGSGLILLLLASCTSKAQSGRGSSSLPEDTEMVIDLNDLTYTIAFQHDQFYSFIGVRALTMVHLAVHDIFNAIDPQYEPYYFHSKDSDFDPVAAAATSTRIILSETYPKRRDTINEVCMRWLNSQPEGKLKIKGVAIGKTVADQYISLRQNDGHEKQGNYTPMTKPGDYQYTPEYDWVWKPDFSVARPFTLDSVSQFRSPPPPTLDSRVYAASFNEVKAYGVKNSTVRTQDQTHFAHWWAEFGEHSWNRIGRITAPKKQLSALETNRMFAYINMNLYDLYLASFDSKYHYDTWRPYTAIRSQTDDQNPLTQSVPGWEPEMLTPPWPEYPSAHAAVGASGAEILTHVYGSPQLNFTMKSVSAPEDSPERTYDNLDQAANDCADSRIMNGFHFRFATEEGKNQGRAVARHTLRHYLRPLP